jgi:hypothetical protein
VAINGRYTAVLDACVLFSRLQRDVLLSLAHADLYAARWTQESDHAEPTESIKSHQENANTMESSKHDASGHAESL